MSAKMDGGEQKAFHSDDVSSSPPTHVDVITTKSTTDPLDDETPKLIHSIGIKFGKVKELSLERGLRLPKDITREILSSEVYRNAAQQVDITLIAFENGLLYKEREIGSVKIKMIKLFADFTAMIRLNVDSKQILTVHNITDENIESPPIFTKDLKEIK